MSRIAARFAELKAQGRAAFVPFITAGDPDFETSSAILQALPGAGADVIELGMPFSDPMADGPAVQASSLRALKAGATMARTLDLVRSFRQRDDIVLELAGRIIPDAGHEANLMVDEDDCCVVDSQRFVSPARHSDLLASRKLISAACKALWPP